MKRYIAVVAVDEENRVAKFQDYAEQDKASAHVTLHNGLGVYDNSGDNMVSNVRDLKFENNAFVVDVIPAPIRVICFDPISTDVSHVASPIGILTVSPLLAPSTTTKHSASTTTP